MKNAKIKKQNLLKLIEVLNKKATVLAPAANSYGDLNFQPVNDPDEVVLKHFKPLLPAGREVLFGQIEDMIRFKKVKDSTTLESINESANFVLFGIPNCDLDAILYNDVFFRQREYVDFYYNNAREKLTIITMACVTPPNESCFCASMGHGPFAENGFDLQLTEIANDYFFVNVDSEKGSAILSNNRKLFEDVSNLDLSAWKDIKKSAEKPPLKMDLNKDKALENMGRRPLDEKMILEISNRCISCGACNYTCPTCTCFNVVDHQKEGNGVRKRILDSCIFAGYFRMAGGHNPKATKVQRSRTRYFCKLVWDKEKFGDSGCVGCGRCLDACPVKIDIKEVIKSLS